MKHGFMDSPLAINDFVKKQVAWSEEVLRERTNWWIHVINNEIWKMPTTNFNPESVPQRPSETSRIATISLNEMPQEVNIYKPIYITFDGIIEHANNWNSVLELSLDRIYDLNGDIIHEMVKDEYLNSFISRYEEDFRASIRFGDSNYFIKLCDNMNDQMQVMKKIIQLMNQPLDIELGLQKLQN